MGFLRLATMLAAVYNPALVIVLVPVVLLANTLHAPCQVAWAPALAPAWVPASEPASALASAPASPEPAELAEPA